MSDLKMQSALTALVPLTDEGATAVRTLIASGDLKDGGLNDVGTVHFARIFMMPEDNAAKLPSNIAAVITTYDGDFASYIQAFVANDSIATIFDALVMAAGATDLYPVQKNAAAFAAWVKKYDVTNSDNYNDPQWGFWYSAYPGKTVKAIKDAN